MVVKSTIGLIFIVFYSFPLPHEACERFNFYSDSFFFSFLPGFLCRFCRLRQDKRTGKVRIFSLFFFYSSNFHHFFMAWLQCDVSLHQLPLKTWTRLIYTYIYTYAYTHIRIHSYRIISALCAPHFKMGCINTFVYIPSMMPGVGGKWRVSHPLTTIGWRSFQILVSQHVGVPTTLPQTSFRLFGLIG